MVGTGNSLLPVDIINAHEWVRLHKKQQVRKEIEKRTVASTGDVKSHHTGRARTKIDAIKTSTNHWTASIEVENIILRCSENWDEVLVPFADKQEGEVEIATEKIGDERNPPRGNDGMA